MDLSYDDVLEILQVVEKSTVDYLEVNVGETKIVLDKSGEMSPNLGITNKERVSTTPESSTTDFMQDNNAGNDSNVLPETANVQNIQHEDKKHHDGSANADAVEIKAPVVGVFYRQSEPGAPPYVEVGSKVEKGDTVGLLEVMKMFTSVTSPASGTVEAILAENNEFVEFDQPLMLIKAETTA